MSAAATDPLKTLKRLPDDAMGPCQVCGRQLLEVGLPVFYRLQVSQCGIDKRAIDERIGLAMQFGGGVDGLQLSAFFTSRPNPVVLLNEGKPGNICAECAQAAELMIIAELALSGNDDAE